MKIVKRILLGLLLVIVAIPVVYIVSASLICPAINAARAVKIEEELMHMALSPQTEAIEADSFCGNTSGTGNHVELWAGLLIRPELSEDELREYYDGMTISYTVYEPMFWAVPTNLTQQYPEPKDFIDFSHFGGMAEAKGYYIIGGYYNAVTQQDIRRPAIKSQ